MAIEDLHHLASLLSRCEGDEAEHEGPVFVVIASYAYVSHMTVREEEVEEISLGAEEGQVANEYLIGLTAGDGRDAWAAVCHRSIACSGDRGD